jgi:signal transduction histidine kinase
MWYSLLFTIFSIIFVASINIWLDNYMRTNLNTASPGYFRRVLEERPMLKHLTEDQIEIIMESRLADLNNIRAITLYSLGPLILLSFAGGYTIASIGLDPLNKLNREMKNKSMENIGEGIDFEDREDEISELIKSFNRMGKRLNRSFEAQKEFVENASHELKTPLTIIQANLDTALEDEKIDKEEMKKLLESSKKSIKFMNSLTEDLLLLSLLDQNIELEVVDIVNLVKEILDKTKTLSNNIKIEALFKEDEIVLKANRILLERAIMNILENAIKYSNCDMIVISVKKENGNAQIKIDDNGKGIPKQDIKKIFDRFYRVDRSRSRETGGSGLGLSISKKIVERFGGTISVSSKKGEGTGFVIKL